MDIGSLRHRVTIQGVAIAADPIRGQTASPPTTIATVWARVEPLEGRELFEAQQLNAVVTHRITLRYLPGVTPRGLVVFNGRTFQIVNVINVEERNVELRLQCLEIA